MINLLPPLVKEQMRFARMNASATKMVRLIIILLILVFGAFAGTFWLLDQKIASANRRLSDQQKQIDSYKSTEEQVRLVNERLSSIKNIQSLQPKFSALLVDLAAVTPKGVTLNGITLTGNDKKPVRLVVTANSTNAAVSYRETLLTSQRIQAADIENIAVANNTVTATIAISFKPGKAK